VKLTPEQLDITQAYQYASKSEKLVKAVKALYRASRDRAKEAFERNDSAAAYWSGRADSLERLLDNMEEASKVDLRDNL
jgi:hypothetical protein